LSFKFLEYIGISSLVSAREAGGSRSHASVHSHDTGASESEVVLEAVLDVVNLAFLGHSSELPAEFSALSETSGTEGMSLGDKAATGVDHDTSSISKFVVIDGGASSSSGAKADSLIGAELVSGETIM